MTMRPGAVCVGAFFLLAAGVSGTARAADTPCGTVDIRNGRVTTGTVLSETFVATPDGQACLKELGKQLAGKKLVRSVTVAVRVPDAQRADGKALALARSLSSVVVAGGMARNRVFALVPRTEGAEAATITVGYTERSPENVVAAFHAVEGDVRVGESDAAMTNAEPGGPILGNERLVTGRDSRVWVKLKDGSAFKLGENAELRMVQLEISATMERRVKLELLKGELETDVKPAGPGSSFETSTRNAVAAVRGTRYRINANESGSARLETLQGMVTLAPKAADGTLGTAVEVPAGRGAGVSAAGKVEAPHALLAAPVVTMPQKGALPREATLSWSNVHTAKSYRVELARDADFSIHAQAYEATTNSHKLADRPAEGKWFWRVSAVDETGFTGQTSKVYAFTVAP